ncbi:MAG TPA: hypothetical protein VF521_03370 [Pyrinomonadaceae bacterium]
MRRARLLSDAAACLLQVVFVCAVLAATSTRAAAQTPPARTERTTAAEADEDFDLNIDQRRISEKDFHAETAVETDGSHGLRLGVGVALSASNIEVLLRNVRGHVRFRGSLAPVLRLLEARRAPRPATQPPPP